MQCLFLFQLFHCVSLKRGRFDPAPHGSRRQITRRDKREKAETQEGCMMYPNSDYGYYNPRRQQNLQQYVWGEDREMREVNHRRNSPIKEQGKRHLYAGGSFLSLLPC